jgi:hypothetical protein
MVTFAKTAIVDYRLSFANQGKQTSIFHFHLQQTNGSLPFPFSICSKQTEVALSISSVFYLWNSGNMGTWTWNHRDGDRKTWRHRHETWKQREMEI